MVGFPASLNNVFNAFFSKVFSFFNSSISVCCLCTIVSNSFVAATL